MKSSTVLRTKALVSAIAVGLGGSAAAAEADTLQDMKAQIEQQIYGWGEEVESNAVDVLIHAIRKRFDRNIIRNVRGAGWMVVKNPT